MDSASGDTPFPVREPPPQGYDPAGLSGGHYSGASYRGSYPMDTSSYHEPRDAGRSGYRSGYGGTHPASLRVHPELGNRGMYGSGTGSATPWYQLPQQHPYQHAQQMLRHQHRQQQLLQHQHQQQQPSATPRCYPMPPEHMYNMFNFNRNGREARNRAEKNRRDKLNGSIQELSAMVPHVAESPRRVDKTAVLRFSAHGLRVDYVFGKSKPEPSVKQEIQDSLFQMLNGFLLTVTCRGQIVLVSASVEQFLGHCQMDLYGQNLFSITHPDDHALLKQQLIPSNLGNLYDGTTGGALVTLRSPTRLEGGSGSTSHGSNAHDEEEDIDRKLGQDKRRFTIRLARAGPRSETTTYELVTIDGCFRRADSAPRPAGTGKQQHHQQQHQQQQGSGSSAMQMIRRARGRDDSMPLHSINGNDIVLIGIARVMKMPSICDRLIEACKYEYKTRHLIDGRIVQCDQRISIVAGYLTDEVSGLSPFTFMHRDDVRWVIVALRQMYDCNQNGESCYRLMARTGDFIYLKTRGYLEVDNDTKVVQSFVCINTLVSEEEGQRMVREMKRKFSVIVDKVELPDESGEPVVENPNQIEEAVLNLITNLQPDSDDKLLMTMPASPASSIKSGGIGDGVPLAIVAPEKDSVKSAIVKSMNVVSIAAKTMRQSRRQSETSEWSPMGGDQHCSNSSSSSCSTSTNAASPAGRTVADGPLSPAVVHSPSSAPSSLPHRPSVLQKGSTDGRPQQVGSPSLTDAPRVPPLPTSEHYFTQPFSPSQTGGASGGSVPLPVLSPASSLHSQRSNAHSPYSGFGGSVPSPPAFSGRIASGGYEGSGSGTRTTSVLKRTYSNSSISSLASSENFGDFETIDSKRMKPSTVPTELTACYNELINPSTDLTSFLPNSFDALDQSLLTMESTTASIREQVGNYPTLQDSHEQRLERIVEEQQEQREMLQSIQQEYRFQIHTNGGNVANVAPGVRANSVGEGGGGVGGNVTPQRTTSAVVTSMMHSVITTSAMRTSYGGASTGPKLEPGS
ncbi:endothelial PAS domain-containing protein 1-like isoform X1 [Anopheles aquasalis]|uniref:endothelial PAS domain-containing protein 1-like isoform X1 n=1 Tax=Anopheles aquasalis TaxID=42839 RepID=UPI00215B0B1B|nr:endothelial PAS domain-containing protein 1-like isoform X1 [Anopheles aquasalis]